MDTSSQLRERLQSCIEIYKDLYPFLPRKWVAEQEKLVEWVGTLSPEESFNLMQYSEYDLAKLTGSEDPINDSAFKIDVRELSINFDWVAPFDWVALLDIAGEEKYELLRADPGSFTMAFFGYLAIYLLAAKMSLLYPQDKGTIDQLFVRFADILETDPRTKPIIEASLERLSQYARNTARKKMEDINMEDINIDDVRFHVGKVIMERFPKGLEESLILAAKGHKPIVYIPNAVATDLIDESTPAPQMRKRRERLRKEGVDEEEIEKRIQEEWRRASLLENPRPIRTAITKEERNSDSDAGISEEVIASLDSTSDISELHEIEVLQSLIRWLDSIEDPQDREIARLHIQGITVREIAEQLSIPKSTVSDRLNKIKPIL